MEDSEDHEALVGRSVKKFFKGFGDFHGKVVSFDSGRGYFKVKYSDGDGEELDPNELRTLLVPEEEQGKRSRKTAAKRRKIASEAMQNGKQEVNLGKRRGGSLQNTPKRRKIVAESPPNLSSGSSKQETVVNHSLVPRERRNGKQEAPDVDEEVNEVKEVKDGVNQDADNVKVKRRVKQEVDDKVEEVVALPPLPQLPCSSLKYDLPSESVLLMFSTYSFLRCFSLSIFLSPFSFEAFVQCLFVKEANALVDQIHLSLLVILRQELEILARDGAENATKCLSSRDWKLLDTVTWPAFMVTYLLTENFTEEHGVTDIAKTEYYELEATSKISVLSFLCDRALDTEKVREHLRRRTQAEDEPESEPDETPVKRTRRSRRDAEDSPVVEPTVTPMELMCVGTGASPVGTGTMNGLTDTDGNSDDCALCDMDGSLLCCDGCPAAYHARCIGVTKSSLPKDEWYCPECTFVRKGRGLKVASTGIRGFEQLGVDLHGRRYMIDYGHIFISDTPNVDSGYTCYTPADIPAVLKFLEVDGSHSASLRKSIEDHSSGLKTTSEVPETALALCTTNEAVAEVPKTRRKPLGNGNGSMVTSAEVMEACYYVNWYSLGAFAALAATSLFARMRKKIGGSAKKSQMADQLKAFCQVPPQFQWPSTRRRATDGVRERCGWCFTCKSVGTKRKCVLNAAAAELTTGNGGLRPQKQGSNHLPSLAWYLLYMEERLNGVLAGPWDRSIEQRKYWRKSVERAQNVRQIKNALLEFGSSLRSIALSKDWAEVLEDAIRPPGTLRGDAAGPPPRRWGRRRKKVKQVENEALWQRGGALPRKIFDWEMAPAATLKRAARQGGSKMLSGLLYNDTMETPRRTAQCAWFARVQSATTISELAIEVRYIDSLVRWSDLYVPEGVNVSDTGSSTVDSVLRSKESANNLVKYLVTSSKTEEELTSCLDATASPSEFIRAVVGDSNEERKNSVWIPETDVPLCLVRDFEEKWRSHTKPRQAIGAHRRKAAKVPRSEVLNWLIDPPKMVKCRQCSLELAIRSGICCQKCQETFHGYCMSGFKPEMCHGCFSASQTRPSQTQNNPNKRSRRPSQKALDMQATKFPTVESPTFPTVQSPTFPTVKSTFPTVQTPTFPNATFVRRTRVKTDRNAVKPVPVATLVAETTPPPAQTTPTPAKTLLVYSRRNKRTAYRFGAPIVKKKRSKQYTSFTGVRWNTYHGHQVLFRQDKVLLPEQCNPIEGPECALCLQPYDPGSLYIGCEHCEGWFHGVALGVTEGNFSRVASFKCHLCRKKEGPVCPYRVVYDVPDCKMSSTLDDRAFRVDEEPYNSEDDNIVLSELGNWSGAASAPVLV